MQNYHVRIDGDAIGFSAAHFILLEGNVCEPLHGHNYRVAAEVRGPLGPEHYVLDFVALEAVLKAILGELDHAVLLPARHPAIRVETGADEVEVTSGGRRWVFPKTDCRLLPLAATTAELLARHIGQQLLERLREGVTGAFCATHPEGRSGKRRLSPSPDAIRIHVEESPGRTAVWEFTDGAG